MTNPFFGGYGYGSSFGAPFLGGFLGGFLGNQFYRYPPGYYQRPFPYPYPPFNPYRRRF